MTSPYDFDRSVIVRCKNHADEPEVCGLTCGVPVTQAEYDDGDWIDVILGTRPEWFVMLRSCHVHGRHVDPYCSLTCFEHVHARHEHPHA